MKVILKKMLNIDIDCFYVAVNTPVILLRFNLMAEDYGLYYDEYAFFSVGIAINNH